MKASPRHHMQAKPSTVTSTPKKDVKASCPGSSSKERDKTTSIDYLPLTKTTLYAHSRKGNNSSTQNFSETTLSSQFLRDSVSKEHESKIQKLTPPRIASKMSENLSQSPRATTRKREASKKNKIDWKKILYCKDKKIRDLEEIIVSMNQEIDQAVDFIEKNKDLPNVLEQKERESEILYIQLNQILKEIDQKKSNDKSKTSRNLEDTKEITGTERYRNPLNRNQLKDQNEVTKRMRNPSDIHSGSYGSNDLRTKNGSQTQIDSRRGYNQSSLIDQGRSKNIYTNDEGQISHLEGMEQLNRFLQNENNANSSYAMNKNKNNLQEERTCKSHRDQGDLHLNQNPLMKLLRALKRSMSPRGADKYQNNQRFEMYNKDLVKKANTQYLKLKSTSQNKKELQNQNSKIQMKRDSKPVLLTENNETNQISNLGNAKIQTKKYFTKHRGASSLSPKRELLMTQKIKMAKDGKELGKQKIPMKIAASRLNFNKMIGNKKKVEKNEVLQDPIESITMLLEDFYRLSEKYKRVVEILRRKNRSLETQMKNINENKSKSIDSNK